MPGPLRHAGLAIAVVVLTASHAVAQSHRLAAAWEAALAEEASYLEPAQIAELNIVAHQAAVASLCEGFEVDVEKIARATNAIVADATAGLEGEELMRRHTDILIGLGTTHGLFLAEGSLHSEAFCAEAAATREAPEFSSFWK